MEKVQALIACSDLKGYAKLTSKLSDEEVFQLLAGYYEFVGDRVATGGGKVIKFMGDAAFMMFSETQAELGVRALLALSEDGNEFLAGRGFACRHHVRAHFGTVYQGELGTRNEKRFDVVGSTVNAMFLLKTSEFAVTPEVFRKLSPETRKLFKKHSLPVTYIPLHHRHG